MSLQAQMQSDIDAFINTDEFAVEATYIPASKIPSTVNVIFDNEGAVQTIDGVPMETTDPQLLVKTSDVPDIAHRDTFVIESVTYYVMDSKPNGTGMTNVVLSRDTDERS